MDEVLLGRILRNISIFVSIIGILTGLDLIFGFRILSALKKVLDKAVNIDNVIARITSALRRNLDRKALDIDAVVADNKIRLALGFLFLALSILMIMLIKKSSPIRLDAY